ncbi:uncharacterized protein LOC128220607 [Mya arenaria]|uniref:uncharacterized protein LOC128220607 n=1 Tax=Mya arenaria TaxID=6604 RepID=UPI0022E2932B|nr:uncharacterized protein LOC128220607 [Mya arenaria]
MDKRMCKPCLFDNTKKEGDGFCVHCVEYLCNDCCREHRKNTGTRGHRVLKDENTPQDDGVYQEIKRLITCQTHPEKDVEFECSDHKQLICVTCFTHSHRECEHIADISSADTTPVDTTATDLQTDLQQLETRNTNVTRMTKRKLSSLQHQKTQVRKACSDFSKTVKKHIDSLKIDVDAEIERGIVQDISVLQNDETTIKETEKEISFIKNMIKAVDGFESNLIRSVVSRMVNIKIREIEQRLEGIQSTPVSQYTFEPEKELTHFNSLGRIVSSEMTELAFLAIDEQQISSEEVMDAPTKTKIVTASIPEENTAAIKLSSESSTSDKSIPNRSKDEVKSFLDMNVSETPQIINVKTSNDKEMCSIVACGILPESVGGLIALDSNNCKLKVFSETFAPLHEVNLSDQPLDMCLTLQNDACTAYICFPRIKTVSLYRISQMGITPSGCFPTKRHPISITSSGNTLLVLSTVRDLLQTPSAIRGVEIIRINGSQHSDLKSSFDLNKCTRIRMLNDFFLVSIEDISVNCYKLNGFKTETLQSKWSCKQGTHMKKKPGDVEFDNAGNTYVCVKETHVIYQVNALDVRDSRQLCRVAFPLSLSMDSKLRRLFVGCMNNDNMYIYHFS